MTNPWCKMLFFLPSRNHLTDWRSSAGGLQPSGWYPIYQSTPGLYRGKYDRTTLRGLHAELAILERYLPPPSGIPAHTPGYQHFFHGASRETGSCQTWQTRAGLPITAPLTGGLYPQVRSQETSPHYFRILQSKTRSIMGKCSGSVGLTCGG